MRKIIGSLALAAALLPLAGAIGAGPSEVDEDLFARRRVFSGIGPGLRAVRHAANGNYYILASPNTGVVVFDVQGKQLSVIGGASTPTANAKSARAAIGFGEDCDVDANGNVYVADRAYNVVTKFSSDGTPLQSFPVDSIISLAALPDGEFATTGLKQSHLVTVYGHDGKVSREFGDAESLSSRPELDRYLNLGRVNSDPQGRVYYAYTYMPEPLIRQFDRFGNASLDFVFSGVDAFPEAQATRKAIAREESRSDRPALPPILTAFGVDPVSGDVWMGLHNTLLHFDKDGIRRSEYQIYTPNGSRLDATVIVVEEERLLIGADPIGVYEFQRPDRKH